MSTLILASTAFQAPERSLAALDRYSEAGVRDFAELVVAAGEEGDLDWVRMRGWWVLIAAAAAAAAVVVAVSVVVVFVVAGILAVAAVAVVAAASVAAGIFVEAAFVAAASAVVASVAVAFVVVASVAAWILTVGSGILICPDYSKPTGQGWRSGETARAGFALGLGSWLLE